MSKKKNENPLEIIMKNEFPLVKALVFFGLTYALVSWAIDSGRIFAYLLTFISLYLGAHFLKLSFKRKK